MKTEKCEDICYVCLKTNINLISISESELTNTKLKFCVPELEWWEGFICNPCTSVLNEAYEFKERCLKSHQVIVQKHALWQSCEKVELVSEKEGHSDCNDARVTDRNSSCSVKSGDENEPPKCKSKLEIDTSVLDKFSCKETFQERKTLVTHNHTEHNSEELYACLHCNKEFKLSSIIKRDESIHLNGQNHVCENRSQSCNVLSTLDKSKITKYTESKYSCFHCDKKYPTKSSGGAHGRRYDTNTGNTYTCYHCNRTHSSRLLLISHIRSKHSPNPRPSKECDVCKKRYINRVVLENHMRKEHNLGSTTLIKRVKRYVCDKCGKKYTTEKTLKLHAPLCDGIKRHSKIKMKLESEDLFDGQKAESNNADSSKFEENDSSFDENIKDEETNCSIQKERKPDRRQRWIDLNCEICNVVIGPYKKLAKHASEEHGVDPKTLKPYRCDECDAKFSSSTHLQRHKTYHAGNRIHICSFCGKGFITKKDMSTHEKLHLNTRDIQCEICSKKFNTKTHLRTHKLVVHTDPDKWVHVCPYCGKRFPMKSNYDQHVRRHTGEKPFACHLCEKRFSDKFVMQQHVRTHSNIRAFKCDHCEKEYKNNRVLEIHLKKVHGIGNAKVPVKVKKFFCEYCPKSFAARDKLTRHMYLHTGERPFSCDVCEKKFTDKSYVKQHLKTVHNMVDFKSDV